MMKKFRKEKKPKEEKFEDGELPVKTKKRKSLFWIFSKKHRNKNKSTSEVDAAKQLEACSYCGHLNDQSLHLANADANDVLHPVKGPSSVHGSREPLQLERVEPVPGSESRGSLSMDGSLSSGFHEVNQTGNGNPRFRERAGARTERRRLSLPSLLNRSADDDVTGDNNNRRQQQQQQQRTTTTTALSYAPPPVPVSMATVRCRSDDSADERRSDVRSRDSCACAERRGGEREEEEEEEEAEEMSADASNLGRLWMGGKELPVTFSDGTTMTTVTWSLEGNRIIGSISGARTTATTTRKEVNTQTDVRLLPEPVSSGTSCPSADVSAACLPGDTKDSDNYSANKEQQPSKKDEGQDFDDEQTQEESCEEIIDESEIKMKSFTSDNYSGIVVDLKEREILQKITSVESASEVENAPKDSAHLASKESTKTNDVIDLLAKQLSVVSSSSEILPDFYGQTASGPVRSRRDARDGDLDVESNFCSSISRNSDEVSSSRSKTRHREPVQSAKEVTSSRGFADVIWIDASDPDNRTASGKAFSGTGKGSPSHNPLRQSLSVASNEAPQRQTLGQRSSSAQPEVLSSGKKPSVTSPKAIVGTRHLCGASWKSVSDLSLVGSTLETLTSPPSSLTSPPSSLTSPPPSVADPEYAALLAKQFQVLSSRFRVLAADADARRSRQGSKVTWYGAEKQNGDNGGGGKIEATEDQKYPGGAAKATEAHRYRSVQDLRFQMADSEDSTSFRSSCASSSVFDCSRGTIIATPEAMDALQLADASLNRPGKKTLHQQLSEVRRHLDQWHRDLTLSNRLLCNNSMPA